MTDELHVNHLAILVRRGSPLTPATCATCAALVARPVTELWALIAVALIEASRG